MRIGILSSSGGSVLAECIAACRDRHHFVVTTDRACGSEALAQAHNIPCKRLSGPDNAAFSAQARAWFTEQGGIDFILLFYLRIATPTLTAWVPTFNFHPSLLPAYAGFNAIDRALADGSRFLGATLHLATDAVDMGPIIAQGVLPIGSDISKAAAAKLSFLQKTYLAFVLIDAMERGEMVGAKLHAPPPLPSQTFNPALKPGYLLTHLERLFKNEGYEGLLAGTAP